MYQQHGQPVLLNDFATYASRLRGCTIFLGVLGLLQLAVGPVQGIVALCSWCQVGCCSCGPTIPERIAASASSLKCKAITVIVFAILYIIAAFVLTQWFCDSVCGIVVMNGEDLVQATAYAAGFTAIEAGVTLYQAAHPAASVYALAYAISTVEATLVYPFDVCDSITWTGIASSSGGIYFPHPLSTFGTYIEIFLLSTNGLMLLLAVASIYYATKISKAQIQGGGGLTAPLAMAMP